MKGPRAGEHLVEHRAEREDVGAVIHRPAEDLLGRHVAGRAADLSGARLVNRLRLRFGVFLLFAELGDAEIQQLDPPAAGDERIGRLDVAMPDAAAVRRVERLGHLHPVLDGLPVGQRAAVETRPQRLPLEHFGDKIRDAVRRTDVEHRHDVGMIQAAGGARFAAEPRHAFRVGRRPAEDLDRHVAAEAGIMGAIDLAHPSGAEHLDDLIRPQPAARGDGQWSLR